MLLFSTHEKRLLPAKSLTERQLSDLIVTNWALFFPHYTFIKAEFELLGHVRSRGTSGRVDILAFNPSAKRFVVIELKKNKDKNIHNQASDYRDFITDHFSDIVLTAKEDYNITLPKRSEIDSHAIDLVLIAQSFSKTDVDRAHNPRLDKVTLVRYVYFSNGLLLLDFLTHSPQYNSPVAATTIVNSISPATVINTLPKIPKLGKVILRDLVDQNILAPGTEIFRLYKGDRIVAQLLADGRIQLNNGPIFNSLSSVSSYISKVSENGWAVWKTLDEKGVAQTLDFFRKKLLQ